MGKSDSGSGLRTRKAPPAEAGREGPLGQIERAADQLYGASTSPVRDEAIQLLKTMADVLETGVDSKAVRRVHAIMVGGRSPDEDALAYRAAVGVLVRFGRETRGEEAKHRLGAAQQLRQAAAMRASADGDRPFHSIVITRFAPS